MMALSPLESMKSSAEKSRISHGPCASIADCTAERRSPAVAMSRSPSTDTITLRFSTRVLTPSLYTLSLLPASRSHEGSPSATSGHVTDRLPSARSLLAPILPSHGVHPHRAAGAPLPDPLVARKALDTHGISQNAKREWLRARNFHPTDCNRSANGGAAGGKQVPDLVSSPARRPRTRRAAGPQRPEGRWRASAPGPLDAGPAPAPAVRGAVSPTAGPGRAPNSSPPAGGCGARPV